MTSGIKDNAKFYPQMFLEEALYNEKYNVQQLKKISKYLMPTSWHPKRQ